LSAHRVVVVVVGGGGVIDFCISQRRRRGAAAGVSAASGRWPAGGRSVGRRARRREGDGIRRPLAETPTRTEVRAAGRATWTDHHHHHHRVACPLADVAVPYTRTLQARRFCAR